MTKLINFVKTSSIWGICIVSLLLIVVNKAQTPQQVKSLDISKSLESISTSVLILHERYPVNNSVKKELKQISQNAK